jgi:hypothetical protein
VQQRANAAAASLGAFDDCLDLRPVDETDGLASRVDGELLRQVAQQASPVGGDQ